MNRDTREDELLTRILTETCSEDDLAEFANLVESDPTLLDDLRTQLDVHQLLQDSHNPRSGSEFVNSTLDHLKLVNAEKRRNFTERLIVHINHRQRVRRVVISSLAAAAALVLTAVVFLLPSKNPAPSEVARQFFIQPSGLASASTAVFEGDQLHLPEGRTKLEFSSGAVLAIEGPANLEVVSNKHVILREGRLNGWCPPEAIGFRVETGKASLVDLGTSFGVNSNPGESSEFVVFDGSVRIDREQDSRVLVNGNSVKLDSSSHLEDVPFETTSYTNTWLLAEGILSTSGSVVPVKPDTPEGIAMQRDDHHVLVYPEKRHVLQEEPLQANLTEPGELVIGPTPIISSLLEPGIGNHLTSYLLHARVEREIMNLEDHVHYVGSVTFDHPVVAVIATRPLLEKSDALLSSSAWQSIRAEKTPLRGLEQNIDVAPGPDMVSLSEDRRTVSIEFYAGQGIDEVRVVTMAPQALASSHP